MSFYSIAFIANLISQRVNFYKLSRVPVPVPTKIL